jgi:ankyrin repeat protein
VDLSILFIRLSCQPNHFQIMGNKVSSLHSASVSGDVERMRRCVDLGANPNDPRIAPIHAAALYKRPDIITFLLDAGGDANGLAPITESLFPGSSVLANPFPKDRLTPLGCAILANDAACVDLLLKRGASPNAVADERAPAPLAIAIASAAAPEIIVKLVDAGAALRVADTDYAFLAAMSGNVGALDVLDGLGVTTDAVRALDTVLNKAEANPDIPVHETVAWFLKRGADICAVPHILQRLVAINDRRLFEVIVNALAAEFD